jgi:4-coumarate--CoA ligase
MNLGLRIGATLVTMPRFDLAAFLDAIQRYRVTIAFVVPPIVLALAKHPSVGNFDLSSLRLLMSGAAPLGADVAAEAQARIKVPVIQGYGMTELSPVSHLSVAGATPAGSVGQLAPNTEARLVDPETGRDAPAGANGELWVRGPMVMQGYLNNPAATAATIDADGWLHTGDVARIDAGGNFYIVDRLKELIKYKGFQVAPAELEALLLTHPEVADAAVIGMPDAAAGELPKAFVVRRAGATVTADALRAFVAGHVATFKQIHGLDFVDAIPKSPSGKILRRLLRDRGAPGS